MICLLAFEPYCLISRLYCLKIYLRVHFGPRLAWRGRSEDIMQHFKKLTFTILTSLCAVGCVQLETDAELASETKSWQGVAHKADGASRQLNEETCRYDEYDDYEVAGRLLTGPFEGACLDTRKRRPLVVVDTPQQNPDSLVVANFFHRDGFWLATLPLEDVEDVYFQLEYFPAIVPAGHTQMRVDFSQPVRLVGHSTWNRGDVEEVSSVVMSIEAVTRLGESYDLFRGTQNHFGVAFRMTSLEARYQSMIVDQDHHVEQWRLLLTEQEKQDFLLFYAYESDALALDETYHTLFRNCTTELIRMLDGVVVYSVGEQIKRFLAKVTEFYPNVVRAALIARGLLPLNQSTDWYALEDDPTYQHP